jgi:hypothetical protein
MELAEIGRMIGELQGSMRIHGNQITELFDQTKEIRTYTDENRVRAASRDDALDFIKNELKDIKKTVNNGLSDELKKCKEVIASVVNCMDRRKEEREEEDRESWTGITKVSWRRFRGNIVYITMCSALTVFLGLIVFAIVKLGEFQGFFIKIVKFFISG